MEYLGIFHPFPIAHDRKIHNSLQQQDFECQKMNDLPLTSPVVRKSAILLQGWCSLDVRLYRVEALLTGTLWRSVLFPRVSGWHQLQFRNKFLFPGLNRDKWAKKNLLTTSLWLHSAEMLYPGCEFCSLRLPGCSPQAPGTP